jgi:hypothetical protein
MKTFLKGMILSLGIVMVLAGSVSAGDYFGNFCFKLDNYADFYSWQVDKVGDAYNVTGLDTFYPAAMDGGGAVTGGYLYLTVMESYADAGAYAIHNMKIAVGTWTGTDTCAWFYYDGTPAYLYPNEPISKVPCSAAGEIEGVPSFPAR